MPECDTCGNAPSVSQETSVEAWETLLTESGPLNFPEGWTGLGNVMAAHRNILNKAAVKQVEYPKRKYQGRGIISCVSAKPGYSSGKVLDHGYLPGAYVMVKELRRLGCTLPITFGHLGPIEWDQYLTELVRPLGVEVIDLRQWDEREGHMRILAGWESKIALVLASKYEEVMYLDADNVPVVDPTFLFHNDRYLAYGAGFWPDLPNYNNSDGVWVPPIVWENAGIADRSTEVDFESGQFMIDKKKCWQEVLLTKHINEHSDYWYKQIFGDKSTFHLAWAKYARPYALPTVGCGWNGGAILQYDFEGKQLVFEHGCQNKPTLFGYPHGRFYLSNPGECYAHLEELQKKWSGVLWQGLNNLSPEDRRLTESMIGREYIYDRVGLGQRKIRFLQDNRIGLGLSRCEVSWYVAGGTLCVSDIEGKPTFFATKSPGDIWVGKWEEYERCNVVLTPV